MTDPFEDQLRSTFRQVAQQTTTSHDLGVPGPAPAPRPSRSRRLIATSALSVLALVGGGVFLATRDNGGPQTVQSPGVYAWRCGTYALVAVSRADPGETKRTSVTVRPGITATVDLR